VKATFKSSHLGVIAGCMISSGSITRNNKARVLRGGQEVWKGNIASIRREREDVKEVKKGFECGILLDGFNDVQVDDVIQAYEITYRTQEL
jgi:translation initiation factor IF-2